MIDLDRIRIALSDPKAPWYGSDVVEWVDDLIIAHEQLLTLFDEPKYERELTRVNAALQTAHPMGQMMGIGLLHTAEGLDDVLLDVIRATKPWANPTFLETLRGRLAKARVQLNCKPMHIRNVVEAVPPFHLVCGSGRYDCAVIASVDPFVLISLAGDMRWDKVTPEMVRVTGEASDEVMEIVNKRFARGY